MEKVFFTPGPSQLFPPVPKLITKAVKENIPSISHRGKKFQEIYQQMEQALRKLLDVPTNYSLFLLSSGTEAMERIIQNCVAKSSFHFVNGAFSQRFFQISRQLGKNPLKYEVSWGQGFELEKVKIPKEIELICFTHNETSTGVALLTREIYQVKKQNPEKLLALDIVSSAPYVNLDYSFLDCVFFSVQKGFGLPAGLAVLIVSPQAIEKTKFLSKKADIGSFHNFLELTEYARKSQTPETPNVLAIYLLGQVAQKMISIGIDKIRKQTDQKAKLLYDFFEKQKNYQPFVVDEELRSKTVIVIQVKGGSEPVIKKLSTRGLIVGSGYKDYKKKHLRISNFPAHQLTDIKQLLSYLSKIN